MSPRASSRYRRSCSSIGVRAPGAAGASGSKSVDTDATRSEDAVPGSTRIASGSGARYASTAARCSSVSRERYPLSQRIAPVPDEMRRDPAARHRDAGQRADRNREGRERRLEADVAGRADLVEDAIPGRRIVGRLERLVAPGLPFSRSARMTTTTTPTMATTATPRRPRLPRSVVLPRTAATLLDGLEEARGVSLVGGVDHEDHVVAAIDPLGVVHARSRPTRRSRPCRRRSPAWSSHLHRGRTAQRPGWPAAAPRRPRRRP